MNPIFEALKAGEQFTFSLLATEVEDLALFWEHWWETHPFGVLDRPRTLTDDDPLLTETIGKELVDTYSHAEFLDPKYLGFHLKRGKLPKGPHVSRAHYRDLLVNQFVPLAPLSEHPVVVFAGGGYGSGKTTTLDYMRTQKQICPSIALGADNFKLFLPEFDQIRMIGDGRASLTVQKEAVHLANQLFLRLVADRRSFVWDSSMSNRVETLARLEQLKTAGYTLKLVAVFTPLAKAIAQAMMRAKETRRFPHPTALPQSHRDFCANFLSYLDFFSEISIFHKKGPIIPGVKSPGDLIGEKTADNKNLVIYDREAFHSFIPPP
jgi:hypothetical protein